MFAGRGNLWPPGPAPAAPPQDWRFQKALCALPSSRGWLTRLAASGSSAMSSTDTASGGFTSGCTSGWLAGSACVSTSLLRRYRIHSSLSFWSRQRWRSPLSRNASASLTRSWTPKISASSGFSLAQADSCCGSHTKWRLEMNRVNHPMSASSVLTKRSKVILLHTVCQAPTHPATSSRMPRSWMPKTMSNVKVKLMTSQSIACTVSSAWKAAPPRCISRLGSGAHSSTPVPSLSTTSTASFQALSQVSQVAQRPPPHGVLSTSRKKKETLTRPGTASTAKARAFLMKLPASKLDATKVMSLEKITEAAVTTGNANSSRT
mmetsp:Transcript_49606/g.141831  ORF Transcript_49606/g.141831 Transcript_49606/m.141831 type:complete len:320 (-) Transcript_49606:1392-2351(-)